jgi:hypothetical protein
MNIKVFSQRFNRELALLGFPDDLNEKIKAISKVFNINRHLANSLIFGNSLPSDELLDKIASILEVCPIWLSGESDKKRAYSPQRETVI